MSHGAWICGQNLHKPIRLRPHKEAPQIRAYDGEPNNTAGLTSVIQWRGCGSPKRSDPSRRSRHASIDRTAPLLGPRSIPTECWGNQGSIDTLITRACSPTAFAARGSARFWRYFFAARLRRAADAQAVRPPHQCPRDLPVCAGGWLHSGSILPASIIARSTV